MREELKTDIWVVSPSKVKDNLNHVHINGYTNLRKYNALFVSGNEGLDMEKYGILPTTRVQVLFMDEPVDEVIDVEDGMFLSEPTADARGLFQDPDYLFEHKHTFRHIRIYTARQKVML